MSKLDSIGQRVRATRGVGKVAETYLLTKGMRKSRGRRKAWMVKGRKAKPKSADQMELL